MYLSIDRNKVLKALYLRDEVIINPIFKEARLGKLKKLKKYLEDSPELLSITDAFKDTLLHHAAYGDAFKTAAYLDSSNSRLNSPNAIGQCPFMTSCLSGSFETAALLLYRFEDINKVDRTKLSAVHLACRSGNMAIVSMLIFCGADLGSQDSDNSLPLHAAAQFGGPNMCSLLLRFFPEAVEYQNANKNTPLHVACGSGNMTNASGILRATLCPPSTLFKITDPGVLCSVPVKRDFCVTIRNEDGQTPEHVAGRLGYYELAALIQNELYKSRNAQHISTPPSRIFLLLYTLCGPPGRRRTMHFWMLAISFGWLYPYLYLRIHRSEVALSASELVIFICMNVFLWVCYFTEAYKNPGFLPTNTLEYEEEMQELLIECRRLQKRTGPLSLEVETTQTELLPLQVQALRRSIRVVKRRLSSLCHTCGCIKPIRAKHCSLCNRCVRVMDHHCPVTDNCVGQANRVWFLLTSVMVSIVSSWIGCLSIRYWQQAESTSLYEIITLVLLSIGWMFGLNACFMTISSAIFNMTTNEMTNWRRYEYFGTAKTGFKNPFSQGCWNNVVEFFCPRYYETERELYKHRVTDGGRYPFVV